MDSLSLQELEATAANYERLLGPAIFTPWSQRLLEQAALQPGQRVLDLACGTGIVARAAAARVGASGSVTGLDANPGMLAVARQLAPEIEWRQGEAESLPFADASFDAVLCQFALMFFDRAAALREMHRVLVPGGRVTVAVFDALENIPAYAALVEVMQRVVGEGAAQALASPFVFGDTAELQALFERAGLRDVQVSSQEGRERFASVRELVLSDVEGWFPFAGLRLDEATLQRLIEEAATAVAPFCRPDGGVEFGVGAHLITASRGNP